MIFFLKIFIKYLFLLVPLLIAVAFLTLLERKIMSNIQRRVGPNKVGFLGLLQPFADGLKIVFKDTIFPRNIHVMSFILGPVFLFALSIIPWLFLEFTYNNVFCEHKTSLLFILLFLGFEIYGLLAAGWASNSKYALLGCLRATSQMIAYEICLGLALSTLCVLLNSLNIRHLFLFQSKFIFFFLPCLPCFLIIFISLLAETYRIPFDLPEAEGEIVAGIHVEYSALLFAFFYLSEYANLIFISFFVSYCFFGGIISFFDNSSSIFFFSLKSCFFIYLFLSIRASLPRYRYDQLLDIGWRVLFPLTLSFFLLYASIQFFFLKNLKIFIYFFYKNLKIKIISFLFAFFFF